MAEHEPFEVVINAQQQAALRQLALSQGITATQHGVVEMHGVKVEYSIDDNYHPVDGSTRLRLLVLHKPVWAPEDIVEEKIHEFLDHLIANPVAVPVPDTHVTAGQVPAAIAPSAQEASSEAPEPDPQIGNEMVAGSGPSGEPQLKDESQPQGTVIQMPGGEQGGGDEDFGNVEAGGDQPDHSDEVKDQLSERPERNEEDPPPSEPLPESEGQENENFNVAEAVEGAPKTKPKPYSKKK